MQVDALALRLRPRGPLEASDLGIRLCQASARSIYLCYFVAAVPVLAVSFSLTEIASWLPPIAIWWAKPWLDQTILFVLSRAAFNQRTSPLDLWRAQRRVWWRPLIPSLTTRRLSPWRSLTEPVRQLEGLHGAARRARVRQVRRRTWGIAAMIMQSFVLAEAGLFLAVVSLVFWLAPPGMMPGAAEVFEGGLPGPLSMILSIAYALAVLFLEPFYVATGFALYLNRRAELEAWDIEQEFRRAFAA